ncbi:MAG: GatB/YqeY domain-containing protein [Candidatus Neomarinimicrobiota bacterium]
MDYTEKIKQDMYLAMKSNEKVKANILRSLLASLKKKQIEDKNTISEEIFYTIVKKMAKQLKESMEVYYEAGRKELAETEKSELKIIQEYLPKQLSEQETLELVKTVITQISAKSMSDIGKVMSLVMQKGGGKVDGGITNRIAKQLLQ